MNRLASAWSARGPWSSLWSPLLWTAYALAPVAGWGLLDGRPLGLVGAGVVGAVWWLWATRRAVPWGLACLTLMLAKLALGGGFLLEHGFRARYYSNPTWSPPHERSLDFLGASLTRVEPRLRFPDDSRADFPLFFVNDLRFNFYGAAQPEREKLAFSVIWEGHLYADDARTDLLYLRGRGVEAQLAMDGQPVLTLHPQESGQQTTAPLPVGWHHLLVKLSVPYGAPREFEAGSTSGPGGLGQPFDATRVFTDVARPWRLGLDRGLRLASAVADGVLLAGLAWWVLRALIELAQRLATWGKSPSSGERAVVALGWLAALVDAFLLAMPFVGRLIVLSGGDDWLTYEAYARDIVLSGPLMTMGTAVGHGSPYYYQPLYPYFLALTHLVFGEDFWGILLVQRLGLAVATWSAWRLSTLLFGRTVGWVTLGLAGAFLYLEPSRLALSLLSEVLFIPLVTLWTQLLIGVAALEPSRGRVVGTGVLGGLATLTRSSLLLAWIAALPLVAWVRLRRHRSVWPVALLVISMACVVSLATARNWVVSHRLVLITSSFSQNLLQGNEPPPSVDLARAATHPVYTWLGLDSNTRAVLEYAAQAPRAFFANLGRKALYALGCFQGLSTLRGCWPRYVAIWVGAALGAAFLVRPGLPEGHRGPERLLPGLVSLTHLGVVVLIFPDIYGNRLVLPLYVLLLPYTAVGVVGATRWLRPAVPAWVWSRRPRVGATPAQPARQRKRGKPGRRR